jgi:hypothetical protein
MCLALVGLGSMMCALVWPTPVERALHSRPGIALVGMLCVLLSRDLRSGMATGFREFWKETRKVAEAIRRAIDGDDDDGPHAA